MCVDFTDLNNTYLKDSFPLPRIDQLVDLTTGRDGNGAGRGEAEG